MQTVAIKEAEEITEVEIIQEEIEAIEEEEVEEIGTITTDLLVRYVAVLVMLLCVATIGLIEIFKEIIRSIPITLRNLKTISFLVSILQTSITLIIRQIFISQ